MSKQADGEDVCSEKAGKEESEEKKGGETCSQWEAGFGKDQQQICGELLLELVKDSWYSDTC